MLNQVVERLVRALVDAVPHELLEVTRDLVALELVIVAPWAVA